MFIIGDLLLYITTSLVFSITSLCIVLHVRAGDRTIRDFLTILVPLTLQMGLISLVTYTQRVLPSSTMQHDSYDGFSLFMTFASVLFTTILLFNMSRFLLRLLPIYQRTRKLGHQILYVFTILFLFLSLFSIFLVSKGDWSRAISLTLNYYFSWGSFFIVIHAIVTLFHLKDARGREEESLLKGVAITFLPLIVFFPLDLIFFREHSFKLGYLSFSIFTVLIYLYVSRHYVRNYEPDPYVLREDLYLSKHDLSDREEEIARLLIQGKTNQEIAEGLFISINTVKTHIKRIYQKLGVSNRVQLMHDIKECSVSRNGNGRDDAV